MGEAPAARNWACPSGVDHRLASPHLSTSRTPDAPTKAVTKNKEMRSFGDTVILLVALMRRHSQRSV